MRDDPYVDLVPPDLLHRLIERLDPEEIWLFGSRATATAREDSDYDLLVIVPDDADVTIAQAYAAADGGGVAVDVVPCRQSGFEAAKNRIGTLSYEAYHRGCKVYGREGL